MAADRDGFLKRLLDRHALRRWDRAAETVTDTQVSVLRKRRSIARALRLRLDRFLHRAEGRLALSTAGQGPVRGMPGAEWAWRPGPWQGPIAPPGRAGAQAGTVIGSDVTVFHDCPLAEVTIRQVRNHAAGGLPPFGLQCDVLGFDGSYLSLAVGLPEPASQALSRQHVLRIDSIVECEHPLRIQARLNIKYGPNIEQIQQALKLDGPEATAEFDLAYVELNEKRISNAWLDLLIDGMGHNRLLLRDLTISRLRRAQL